MEPQAYSRMTWTSLHVQSIALKTIHKKKPTVTEIFQSPKGSGDEEYLSTLAQCLNELDRINFVPDLILYDAAVDVHNNDKLGLLKMTSDGIYHRDQVVLSHFKDRQVPVLSLIHI